MFKRHPWRSPAQSWSLFPAAGAVSRDMALSYETYVPRSSCDRLRFPSRHWRRLVKSETRELGGTGPGPWTRGPVGRGRGRDCGMAARFPAGGTASKASTRTQ